MITFCNNIVFDFNNICDTMFVVGNSYLLKVSVRRNDMEGSYFKHFEGCDLKHSEGIGFANQLEDWDGNFLKELK